MNEKQFVDLVMSLSPKRRASLLRVAAYVIWIESGQRRGISLWTLLRGGLEYFAFKLRSVCHG